MDLADLNLYEYQDGQKLYTQDVIDKESRIISMKAAWRGFFSSTPSATLSCFAVLS